MKAVILASGVGKRLMPLTKKIPKSLITFGGMTILERIIQSLIENNVTDIIVTTGHLEEKIKEFIKNKYPELKITYVRNPIFNKTNCIHSLWLAKKKVEDNDIVLLHGDLIYDLRLMKKIIKEKRSSVLIKKEGKIPKEDFKARIKNGLVTEIGVKVFDKNVKFCAPLYKFLKSDFEKLIKKIDEFIKEKKVNCYVEDALNTITNEIKLHPLYYNKEFCMEIDDFDDLKKAKKYFKNGTNFIENKRRNYGGKLKRFKRDF